VNSHVIPVNGAPGAPQVSARLAKNATRHLNERLIEGLLFCAAAVSVLTTVGIVYVLLSESIEFFKHVSLIDFLTDTQWTPLFDDAHFGIMVLISGTLVSSGRRLAGGDSDGHHHRYLSLRIRQCQSA